MGLYDTGEPLASADDFLSLGGVGAGSFSDELEPPGLDTSGRLLNVYPDPGLDKLTTGEYKESDFSLHQTKHLKNISSHLEKIANREQNEYVRAQSITSVTGIVVGTPTILAGWSLKEFAGFPLEFDLLDGLDGSSSLIVASFRINTSTSNTQWLMPNGIKFQQGIFLKITSGTGVIKGSLYLLNKKL